MGHGSRYYRVLESVSIAPALSSALTGATENAGVENAIRAKMQGWKMQEGKCRSSPAAWES